MRVSGLIAFAVAFGCQVVATGQDGWTVASGSVKYARIEGDRLFVDVPKGVSNACVYATRPIDLSDFAQSMLEAHVRCRGEDLVRDARPARGVKLSLHYVDPVTGVRFYPYAPAPEEGRFAWTNLALGVSFGEVTPKGAQLVLGLQQTSGRLEFDLSSFSFGKAPLLFPSQDNLYEVRYPKRIADLPRMRGVMGRGCCRNTEQDIEDLKNYGANLIRLQMNGFFAKRSLKPGEKAKTLADWDRWLARNLDHAETVLGWLEKRGMMMVLDLHNPPLNGYGHLGDVFYVQAYADRLVSAWREIAARFKGRKGIYGYDIMNEPQQERRALPDCDFWNLQRRTAEAIREIDPDATIVFEANHWDSPGGFEHLRALEMDNVIYQVHMYRPGAFTHQGANGATRPSQKDLLAYPNREKGWDREYLRRQLEPVRAFQKRHKAKIFVGEFSACIYGPGAGDYLADCIALFEEYGWDWTYHSFREALWWNVETVIDEATGKPVANFDNPRFRALLDGFAGRVSGNSDAGVKWPLVMMREAPFDGHADVLRRIVEIHGRRPGSVDEIWTAGCGIFRDDRTCRELAELADVRKDFDRAGIEMGFQQGFTLGHADLMSAGIGQKDKKDVYPYPEDAWAVGRDGRRLESLCARSPAVLKRQEEYVAMLARVLKPTSLWLDDDLRMGCWKPDCCFCPRCLDAFNREENEQVGREELVERLFSRTETDAIRSKWFRFNDRSCALYAAAVRRALNRECPNCRLGLQLTGSYQCYNGVHRKALFAAASENGRHPVGIRISGGMYNEWASPRALLDSLQNVMKTVGDARRLSPRMIGCFAFENENYPREAINKSAEAILRQSALAFAAGCDATTIYTYWQFRAEPLEMVDEFADLLARWRPYYERLSDVSKRTSSCGVAFKVDDARADRLPAVLMNGTFRLKDSLSQAYNLYDFRNAKLSIYGIPVVPQGAGEVALLDAGEFDRCRTRGTNEMTTEEAEKLRDLLDARSDNKMPVRVGKNHAVAVYPRVDGNGRLVAVTFFNCSMGTMRKMPVRLRRPAGRRFVWRQETQEDVELQAAEGRMPEERCLVLPDLPGYAMATVFVESR